MGVVDAVITAGGKGSRIKEMEGEKPLIPLLGKPLIDYVIEAVRSSRSIGEVYATVSANTPQTKAYLREKGVMVIETSGIGYVEDLNHAMNHPRSDHVFVCPVDMPLLTGRSVDLVVDSYFKANKASYSVVIPLELLRSLGMEPTFKMEWEGRNVVLCGVSVVNRLQMLSMGHLDDGYMLSDSLDLAVNVNTVSDLKRAERILRERVSAP